MEEKIKEGEEAKKARELHGQGCRCTYCDKESQDTFQDLLRPEGPTKDYLGTTKPHLFTFEGQTKEEAEALLKKEQEKRAEFEALWETLKKQPEVKAHFGDDEFDEAEPELHRFVDQSLDDVRELIRKSCEQSWEKQKLFEEPCPEPCLIWGDAGVGEVYDIRTRKEKQVNPEDICDFNPELITLAGVAPEGTKVPNEPVLNHLMTKIIKRANRKYPKLNLQWSDSIWDKRLLVNGAPTRIRYQRLRSAFDGLTDIIGKQEAAKIVGQLVMKKLKTLFI
jgi:hypothetical protein